MIAFIGSNMPWKSLELKHTITIHNLDSEIDEIEKKIKSLWMKSTLKRKIPGIKAHGRGLLPDLFQSPLISH